MTTNFGAAAEDYANCRAGFPESLFERLARQGVGQPGQTIVDVGTGTGAFARGLAARGATVIGVDPDPRLVDQARLLDSRGQVSIEYRIGKAEALPLENDVADVVAAAQCFHWFSAVDAAREFSRITRVGGRVVIAHFDWLPLVGSLVEATEQLIQRHNADWNLGGGNGFHTESLPALSAAGFAGFESFSYDVDAPYTPAAWRGRIRASAGVGASLTPQGVEAFDEELARLMDASFPGDLLQVPHRVFAIVGSHGPRT